MIRFCSAASESYIRFTAVSSVTGRVGAAADSSGAPSPGKAPAANVAPLSFLTNALRDIPFLHGAAEFFASSIGRPTVISYSRGVAGTDSL